MKRIFATFFLNDKKSMKMNQDFISKMNEFVFTTEGYFGIGISNPAVGLHVATNDAIGFPIGTILERPIGISGYVTFNTDIGNFEGFGIDGKPEWSILGSAVDTLEIDDGVSAGGDLIIEGDSFFNTVFVDNGVTILGDTNIQNLIINDTLDVDDPFKF